MGTTEKRAGRQQNDRLGQSAAAEETLRKFNTLDFSVHKSRRYHEKLASFYGGWRDASKYATLLGGSGIFLLLTFNAGAAGQFVAALLALFSALNLVSTPDKKSERHTMLAKSFTELAADIVTSQRTEAGLARLAAARLEIEKSEPPCKRLVDLEARNDECRARGYGSMVPLSSLQRRLGRYFDFDMERLERWKAESERAVDADRE